MEAGGGDAAAAPDAPATAATATEAPHQSDEVPKDAEEDTEADTASEPEATEVRAMHASHA
jgi:hypothetical protein